MGGSIAKSQGKCQNFTVAAPFNELRRN